MRQRVTFRFLRTMRSLRCPLFGARSAACSRARSRSRSRACSRGGDGRLGVETYIRLLASQCVSCTLYMEAVCAFVMADCLLACAVHGAERVAALPRDIAGGFDAMSRAVPGRAGGFAAMSRGFAAPFLGRSSPFLGSMAYL